MKDDILVFTFVLCVAFILSACCCCAVISFLIFIFCNEGTVTPTHTETIKKTNPYEKVFLTSAP